MLSPGVGNRGVWGYTPPGRKNFEYTPLGGAKRRRHFFGRISEINVNLTGFSLNLVKFTLI